MSEVRWTPAARDDVRRIAIYLKERLPEYAETTADRLIEAAESLSQFPFRGRVGRLAGTRELVLPPLPYVIVYIVKDDVVWIARIVHGAQDWPSQ